MTVFGDGIQSSQREKGGATGRAPGVFRGYNGSVIACVAQVRGASHDHVKVVSPPGHRARRPDARSRARLSARPPARRVGRDGRAAAASVPPVGVGPGVLAEPAAAREALPADRRRRPAGERGRMWPPPRAEEGQRGRRRTAVGARLWRRWRQRGQAAAGMAAAASPARWQNYVPRYTGLLAKMDLTLKLLAKDGGASEKNTAIIGALVQLDWR